MGKGLRSKTVTLLTTLFGGVLLFFFQNCQGEIQRFAVIEDQAGRAPAADFTTQHEPVDVQGVSDPVEIAKRIYSAGKVQLDRIDGEPLAAMQSKLGTLPDLPAGEPLIAVIDNACAAQDPHGLSGRIRASAKPLDLAVQTYAWVLEEDLSLNQLNDMAERDPCLLGLSSDGVARSSRLPNDPYMHLQQSFKSIGGPESYAFFNDPLRGAKTKVVVAVIDSGVNYNHPDLKDNLWKTEVLTGSYAYGWNFHSQTEQVLDSFGHGTAVAGILAASGDNGIGTIGVMSHDIEVMSLKVQDAEGNAFISHIAMAIDYARGNGAHVINISMEAETANAALQTALAQAVAANIFVAVAAGNGNKEIKDDAIVVPAYYARDLAGVMAVGSIDSYSGNRSSFSNFGPTFVEIAAPGSTGVYFPDKNGGYSSGQGTSYACPMVTGAAALTVSFLKQHGITYTAADIENILKETSLKNEKLSVFFKDGNILDLRSLGYYLRSRYLTPLDGGYDEN